MERRLIRALAGQRGRTIWPNLSIDVRSRAEACKVQPLNWLRMASRSRPLGLARADRTFVEGVLTFAARNQALFSIQLLVLKLRVIRTPAEPVGRDSRRLGLRID